MASIGKELDEMLVKVKTIEADTTLDKAVKNNQLMDIDNKANAMINERA